MTLSSLLLYMTPGTPTDRAGMMLSDDESIRCGAGHAIA